MLTQVNPQEIYMLECYTSLDYFGEMRDTWAEMVTHVEFCLDSFMENLPAEYRSRPLPEQPDIVWGNRVLTNFRGTLQGLNTGVILLTHGDAKGLNYAHGPASDFKGQSDFWAGWMAKADEDLYKSLLNKAAGMATNIILTEGAYWTPPLPLTNYSHDPGSLKPPTRWPTYQINIQVSVRTGAKTKQSGIYVPDIADSCVQFLSTNFEIAPAARVHAGFNDVVHPITGEKTGEQPIFEKRQCTWYLLERTASPDIVAETPAQALDDRQSQHRSIVAGETCPATGFYFTPARIDSRRFFKKGEVMPVFDTAYGATIWQRDTKQT